MIHSHKRAFAFDLSVVAAIVLPLALITELMSLDLDGIPGREVDGVVEMMLDATENYDQELTDERLFGWHAALFPTGRSGMRRIKVGAWRPASAGPMQVPWCR